jgi:hypothetical protein
LRIQAYARRANSNHLFYELLILVGGLSAARCGAVLRASPVLAAAVRVLAGLFWTSPGDVHDELGVALPALHTMQLYHCSLNEPRAVPGFASTRRLIITHTSFANMEHMVALLGTLPRLSALEFDTNHPGSYVAVVADTPVLSKPSFALTYLDLRGISQREVVDALTRWLCAPGSHALTRLETLCTTADLYTYTGTVAPRLLLETAAPTLKELRVIQCHSELSA